MIPLHAVAIAVLVRVVLHSRRFDPWLRLTAGAALALHPVAWFYLPYDRYYFLTWFLTLLVCAAWLRDEGLELIQRWFPRPAEWFAHHPMTAWLARVRDWWARVTAVA